MHPYRKFLVFCRVFADLAVIALSFFAALQLAYVHYQPDPPALFTVVLIALETAWLLASQTAGLYSEFRSEGLRMETKAFLKTFFALAFTAVVCLFAVKDMTLSRFFLAAFIGITFPLLVIEKSMASHLLHRLRRNGKNLRRVLFIGYNKIAERLADMMDFNPNSGYRIVGFLDDVKDPSLNGRYLGALCKLDRILEERRIDDVFVTLSKENPEKVLQIANTCEKYMARVQIVPQCFSYLPSRYGLSIFDRLPIVSLEEDRINELHWRVVKRLFDFCFSTVVILIVFSWLFPIIAAAIKLSSPGPVFFRQERGGKNHRMFKVVKFRTMKQDSIDTKQDGKFNQAKADDPRTTRVGKFLRRTNFDELPQFFNVLKGEMSVVGPRPHATLMDFESRQITERYMRRHLVKPGITGFAQVHGCRGEIHCPDDLVKRVEMDIWYMENWSFAMDVKIIFLTLWQMVRIDPNAY